jgi:protein-tyrosine phosphatase
MNIEDLSADLNGHHIEGIAREGNRAFKVPLISHVQGNLWQGGCVPGVRLPDDFDFVVSLYPWGRYELGPNTVRVEIEMYDAQEVPDEAQLLQIAKIVNAFRAKGKTLVHCQAGLNRSALVSALALVLDGIPASEAITLLRERRSDAVLCNATV